MPTPDEIEAAARAIHATFGRRSTRARDWDDLPEKLRRDYRDEARAALDAAIHASA